jgi:putative serine protease PepD
VERSEWYDEEPEGFSPFMPPAERSWRHPSELGAAAGGAASLAPRRPGRGRIAFALMAASTGALALYGLATLTLHPASRPGLVNGNRSELFPGTSESSLLSAPLSTLRRLTGTGPASALSLVATGSNSAREFHAVVLDGNGTLVTSSDMVGDATTVETIDAMGNRAPVHVMGTDRSTGLTVLQAAHVGQGAPVASCSSVAPGDLVQLGDGADAAWAKVSEIGLRADHDGQSVYPLIRITPTSSFTVHGGDAVFDASGHVVAVAIANDGDNVLAAPTDVAIGLVTGLQRHGHAGRAWLGVSGSDSGSAAVDKVTAGSPAANAGLAEGDIIDQVDGHAVSSMWSVVLLTQRHTSGDLLTLRYRRGPDVHSVVITLVERPTPTS